MINSCYDCHSNETNYPWYSYLAPASFIVTDHVKNGRKHLNFSDWENYTEEKKEKKLHEIWEEVEEVEMPISGYVLLHSEAELSGEQMHLLKTRVENEKKLLKN